MIKNIITPKSLSWHEERLKEHQAWQKKLAAKFNLTVEELRELSKQKWAH